MYTERERERNSQPTTFKAYNTETHSQRWDFDRVPNNRNEDGKTPMPQRQNVHRALTRAHTHTTRTLFLQPNMRSFHNFTALSHSSCKIMRIVYKMRGYEPNTAGVIPMFMHLSLSVIGKCYFSIYSEQFTSELCAYENNIEFQGVRFAMHYINLRSRILFWRVFV